MFACRITTLDPTHPSATDAAIENRLFAAVGEGREIMMRRRSNTVVIDIQDRTTVPGA
jgi:predicted amidohydrolase YtcJ